MDDRARGPLEETHQAHWTFLSNHAHVLICIGTRGALRVRDIAAQVGITERAVQRILRELEEAGVLLRVKEGRRTRYSLHLDAPLRHPLEDGATVGDLLGLAGTHGAAASAHALLGELAECPDAEQNLD